MNLECKFEKRVSNKGNEYYCLFVPLLEKTIFLEKAEVKLIQMLLEKKQI